MHMAAAEIISALGLEPHPEGGWYAETFRDADAGASFIWCMAL